MAVSYHQPGEEPGMTKGGPGSCSLSCLKFSLYCYNILLLIFGLAGLSVGLWSLVDRGQFLSLLTTSIFQVSGVVILLSGALVVTVTILGCCGISRESNSLILSYSGLLAITVLLQCIIGLTAYIYREQVGRPDSVPGGLTVSPRVQVHSELVLSLNRSVTEEYGVVGNNQTRLAMDDLQSTFRCCGAESFEDWSRSGWWEESSVRQGRKVPDSCCKTWSVMCGVRDHPSNVFYTGCAYKLSQLVGDHLLLIGSIALVICLVEGAGVVLSVKLVRKLSSVGD